MSVETKYFGVGNSCRPSYGWTVSGSAGSGSLVSGSTLSVYDEGTLVLSEVECINFVGADVFATGSNLGSPCVFVYIPPPEYPSHWHTLDGTTIGTVTDPTSTTVQRISIPTSEGNPYQAGGWESTNQAATLNPSQTWTSAEDTVGFGGDSTFLMKVVDASGSVVDSYVTPALSANGTYTSGAFSLALTNYGAVAIKFSGSAAATVDVKAVLASASLSGGRYHVELSHSVDTASDGGAIYVFSTSEVFYDTNETTPSISGTVKIGENSGSVWTKHLSGIEYYTTGSQFSASISGVINFNNNTQATSNNLRVRANDYGLPDLYQSPFGAGAGNFSGWTDTWDDAFVTWGISAWSITQSNYRFIGTTANADGRPRDGWNNGSTVNSTNEKILVDTYGISATNLYEPFVDETRRLESDYTTAWDSERFLTGSAVSGTMEAVVQNDRLQIPAASTYVGESSATNADWTDFHPDKGGINPDYTGLDLTSYPSGAVYYRAFPDTTGLYIPSMTLTFAGTFSGSSATADLASGSLEIYIRKFSGSIGQGGSGSAPLEVHGIPYNSGEFNDGIDNGQPAYAKIRTDSSSDNTVECTFGTFTMLSGVFMEIRLKDNDQKINSLTITYN